MESKKFYNDLNSTWQSMPVGERFKYFEDIGGIDESDFKPKREVKSENLLNNSISNLSFIDLESVA